MRPTREQAARRGGFQVLKNARPCHQCPWVLENQGTRHPGGWYSKANLSRLWAGLRRGERMTCHPTDPAMDIECSCHRPVRPGTKTRECAGALILIQRELMILQDHPSVQAYRRARPRGLTIEGAWAHATEALVGGTLFGGAEMARPNLNDTTVGYEPLGTWETR